MAIAIAGTLYFLHAKRPIVTSDTITATTTSRTTEARQMPDGWREYQNVAYGFSLFYPQELTVDEHKEGEGVSTITFQNIERGEGFQIFVMPYHEERVSEERFRKDVPSGVRTDMSDTTIDGATGATFYSTNMALGDMREVWFIRGGRLYEVTTLKSLDTWLGEIMKTWKFL